MGILALPFKPLYSNISLLSFPFQLTQNPSHAPSLKNIISSWTESPYELGKVVLIQDFPGLRVGYESPCRVEL